MKTHLTPISSSDGLLLDRRLTAYLASLGVAGVGLSSSADAAVVGNATEQPFGIDGEVSIDFNGDGQRVQSEDRAGVYLGKHEEGGVVSVLVVLKILAGLATD